MNLYKTCFCLQRNISQDSCS